MFLLWDVICMVLFALKALKRLVSILNLYYSTILFTNNNVLVYYICLPGKPSITRHRRIVSFKNLSFLF